MQALFEKTIKALEAAQPVQSAQGFWWYPDRPGRQRFESEALAVEWKRDVIEALNQLRADSERAVAVRVRPQK